MSSFKSKTDAAMSVVKYSGATLLGFGVLGYAIMGAGFASIIIYGAMGLGMLYAGVTHESKVAAGRKQDPQSFIP